MTTSPSVSPCLCSLSPWPLVLVFTHSSDSVERLCPHKVGNLEVTKVGARVRKSMLELLVALTPEQGHRPACPAWLVLSAPSLAKSYVHRVGRTARVTAITLVEEGGARPGSERYLKVLGLDLTGLRSLIQGWDRVSRKKKEYSPIFDKKVYHF